MAGPTARQRPLSPHLQIYKWGPHMLVSILHRVTGDGLSIVGSVLLLWWLGALASGPAAYADFVAIVWGAPGQALTVWNWLFRAVLVGLSYGFFQHTFSGLRHLVLDTGAGYELKSNKNWSVVVAVAGPLATVALWLGIAMGNL